MTNVPQEIIDAEFESFKKDYEGSFINQHGHTIQAEAARAFEVLYMAGGLDACRRKSILKNSGASGEGRKGSSPNSGRSDSNRVNKVGADIQRATEAKLVDNE